MQNLLTEPLKIGFLGLGKVGTNLAWALRHAASLGRTQFQVLGGYSRQGLKHTCDFDGWSIPCFESAQALVDCCDIVFVTVPDDAIAPLCSTLNWRHTQLVIHCSGATELAALCEAQQTGADVAGLHPLKTFANLPSTPEAALQEMAGCTAGIEVMTGENGLNRQVLDLMAHLAQALGMHTLHIPPGQRALYHASANYAGAFVPALLQEAVLQWQSMGANESQALAALLPLLKSTVSACETALSSGRGLPNATVGPVARGDVGTVQKHLQALSTQNREALAMYALLSKRVVALGLARGTLTPEKAAEIQRLLGN